MKQSVMSINGMSGLEVKGHITIGTLWLGDLSRNLECLHYRISELWSIGMGMIALNDILNRK
jgi:hypothetical protein